MPVKDPYSAIQSPLQRSGPQGDYSATAVNPLTGNDPNVMPVGRISDAPAPAPDAVPAAKEPILTQAQAGVLADPTTVNVTDPGQAAMIEQDQQMGTVEGRSASIIDKNSPLMQRAAAKAREWGAGRGMADSSITAGAAQTAVLDKATDIALPDATSFTQIQRDNQAAENRRAEFAAGEKNIGARQDAQQANAMATEQARLDHDAIMRNMSEENQLVMTQLEAQYRNEMQANESSQQLYTNTMAAISRIQENPDMNAETKQHNINQLTKLLESGLNMSGSIANLNLGGLMDFSEVIDPTQTPEQAATAEAATATENIAAQRDLVQSQIDTLTQQLNSTSISRGREREGKIRLAELNSQLAALG